MLDFLQADLVAKGFEALDETTLEGILVAAVEVVAAEIAEVGAILEEVVADDKVKNSCAVAVKSTGACEEPTRFFYPRRARAAASFR